MTEREYVVMRPLVRDRFYQPGETITLSEPDALGLLHVEPGILLDVEQYDNQLQGRRLGVANELPLLDFWPDYVMLDYPHITDDCFMPPYRGGDHNDLGVLQHVAACLAVSYRNSGNMRVLELGTAYGNSAQNMSIAIASVIEHYIIDTVNALPEQISGDQITKAFTREEIGRVITSDAQVIQIYSNTLNLTPDMLSDQYDLCVIDACHDQDYVSHDIEVCRQVMSEKGIILLHDVYFGSGPYQALQMMLMKGTEMIVALIPGTWWAVAAWKPGIETLKRRIKAKAITRAAK